MEKRSYFDEKSFSIIFFVSLFFMLALSPIISLLKIGGAAKTYISYALPQLVYIGATVVYSHYTRIDLLAAVPVKVKIKPKKYAWAVAATIGLFCFALLPNALLMTLFIKLGLRATVSVPAVGGFGGAVLSLVIICILPAVGEELVFRGVLASALKDYGGAAVVLISGLLFSLSHFNTAQTVYQFFFGALLAYVYLKTNNLLIVVIMHFLNNAIAVFLPRLIPFFATLTFSGQGILMMSLMCVIGFFVLLFSVRKLTGQRAADEITVFEYHAESGEMVAVGAERIQKGSMLKAVSSDIKSFFMAIIRTFKKGEIARRLQNFNSLFPRRKKLGVVIKINIAVIIGLWLITILL